MNFLKEQKFKCSVSSVLNRDTKQNGKQFMFDGVEDTSWNSNEGQQQWITIRFEEPQAISAFSFQFQGGFVGIDATVRIDTEEGVKLYEEPFYPDDINSEQCFPLKNPVVEPIAKTIRFTFDKSSDFFGRIIVYKLEIFN